MGKRGYSEYEVDAFLDRVEAALRDPAGPGLASAQVGLVLFSPSPRGKRGYNQDEVDAFLDRVTASTARTAPAIDEKPIAGPVGGVHERISPQWTPGSGLPRPPIAIQPHPFLFWTPRWRDWRTYGSGSSSNTSSDSILGDMLLIVLQPIFDYLWPWFMGALNWVVEVCVAVLLAPIALLASVVGMPRHRLVAVTEDGSADYVMHRGSWYAVLRAKREALASAG